MQQNFEISGDGQEGYYPVMAKCEKWPLVCFFGFHSSSSEVEVLSAFSSSYFLLTGHGSSVLILKVFAGRTESVEEAQAH